MLIHRLWGHLATVMRHKALVGGMCFRVGLWRQGITHDLSKFSPTEFIPSVRYYQEGKRSHVGAERRGRGYSGCWMHHKGRNRHHFEYWLDYAPDSPLRLVGYKMPPKFFAEMIIDRIAASMVYLGGDYTDGAPLEYFMERTDRDLIHPETLAMMEKMFVLLKREGKESLFAALREIVRNGY